MKKGVLGVMVVLLALSASLAFAEYDQAKVVAVMKANGALMGELKKSAENNDFYAAAETLMAIAKEMKSLEGVTPEKGEKAAWDHNHQTLIKTALKGIGACGEEDADKLKAAIAEIGGLIKEGHAMFK